MWSKPTWISDHHYLDWIFLVYENNHLFNFPIWSYVKDKSCGVCHLGFWLTQKHTHFVKDHQRNTPVMISVKCLYKKKKKKKRTFPCGDGLLGFFLFSIEIPLKTLFFLNLISIEKPLELILKTIGFYLKLHWISIYMAKYANGYDHFNDTVIN